MGWPGCELSGILWYWHSFSLLRVGEYTKSPEPRQTVPLRRQDIKLWRNNTVLPHTTPLEHLLQADAVSIFLDNQKNGFRGATLHHTASGNTLCPVKSAAHLVHQIADAPRNDGLGYLRGPGRSGATSHRQ